jgi:hypothetical protein
VFVLPDHLTAQLSQEIAAYIPTFVPQRGLTAQQWARCREAVWTSCAATLPPTRVDAKTQMSVTCAFLAFTDKVAGSVDLPVVLTEDLVNRFLIASEGTVSAGTRGNRRGHLRRAMKAAAGDAPRTAHAPRSAGPQPYSRAELGTLAATAFSCAPLAGALARGLGAGAVVPAAIGTLPPASDAVRGVTRALGMDVRWMALIAHEELSAEQWKRARAAAETAGVPLITARLRATWVAVQLAAPRPLAEIARRHGLTRADLNNAAAHLPPINPMPARTLLRG